MNRLCSLLSGTTAEMFCSLTPLCKVYSYFSIVWTHHLFFFLFFSFSPSLLKVCDGEIPLHQARLDSWASWGAVPQFQWLPVSGDGEDGGHGQPHSREGEDQPWSCLWPFSAQQESPVYKTADTRHGDSLSKFTMNVVSASRFRAKQWTPHLHSVNVTDARFDDIFRLFIYFISSSSMFFQPSAPTRTQTCLRDEHSVDPSIYNSDMMKSLALCWQDVSPVKQKSLFDFTGLNLNLFWTFYSKLRKLWVTL